jgi:hypothetical protein
MGITLVVLSYAVPAIVIWAVLGLAVSSVPLASAALVATVVYALFYGVHETGGRAVPPAPGSRWQVPSGWVRGVSRTRRIIVWGSLLGPGFATRNPYAGFGLLALVAAAVGNIRYGVPLAAGIGLSHALGRSFALVRDVHGPTGSADYFQTILKGMRWRLFDGYALLLIGGFAIAACAARYS